jgi:Spondin_N
MMVIGERMYNTSESQHLPPVNVTFEHPFLSSMVKMTPSPDWFAGFSDFRTISFDTETYFNRFVLQSYVWDSGTDAGLTYTALDRDLDPQVPVSRIQHETVPPLGQFLSPDGSFIPVPGEFECVLRVGEGSVITGIPFNESDIRPPLYVPRPDDDWIGNPDFEQNRCAHGNFKGCEGYVQPEDDSNGETSGSMGRAVPSAIMMTLVGMILTMLTSTVATTGWWNILVV